MFYVYINTNTNTKYFILPVPGNKYFLPTCGSPFSQV